jgi:hypothetical protein
MTNIYIMISKKWGIILERKLARLHIYVMNVPLIVNTI